MQSTEERARFSELKQLVTNGDISSAFAGINSLISPDTSFALQQRAARLVESMDRSDLDLQPIRIAIVASSTTDHLVPLARYWLARCGLDAKMWTAPYDTAAATCLDAASQLYHFQPDIIWLFSNWRDVDIRLAPGSPPDLVEKSVELAIERMLSLVEACHTHSDALVILNNADIPAEEIFGNFEASVGWSVRNTLRSYNVFLGQRAGSGTLVLDLDHIASSFGKARWEDPRYWYYSKHICSPDALGLISSHFSSIVSSAKGLAKKCLVLDLDNTLWGGVIGDDGVEGIKLGSGVAGEAFSDLQRYVKKLKDRGIILAVCSKNDEVLARQPFEEHPDMVLSLNDISVFVANWHNKADNIVSIAEALNIGLDSLVFLDDNPAERDLVRTALPMVAVPDLSDDPSDYLRCLQQGRYFESVTFSDEDRARADSYTANAARTSLKDQFSDLSLYLQNLDMTATVGIVDQQHMPRAAQLINKSNQFHLTGTRYTESALKALVDSADHEVRFFKLTDRFGDNGLVSVVILKREDSYMAIDTWVMSCRVLGRQMEEFIANEVSSLAYAADRKVLVGRYVRSKKNELVAELYERLGFTRVTSDQNKSSWEIALPAPRWNTAISTNSAQGHMSLASGPTPQKSGTP